MLFKEKSLLLKEINLIWIIDYFYGKFESLMLIKYLVLNMYNKFEQIIN